MLDFVQPQVAGYRSSMVVGRDKHVELELRGPFKKQRDAREARVPTRGRSY
jgi:hypothetical protein